MATLGGNLASYVLLHRFLSHFISLVVLAIVSAFMVCGLIAGGLVLAYLWLLQDGNNALAAAVMLGVLAILAAALLVTATMLRLRQLQDLPVEKIVKRVAKMPNILAQAFLHGFLNPKQ